MVSWRRPRGSKVFVRSCPFVPVSCPSPSCFKHARRIELTTLAGPIRARSRYPRSIMFQACRPPLRSAVKRAARDAVTIWKTDSTDTNGHERTVVPARQPRRRSQEVVGVAGPARTLPRTAHRKAVGTHVPSSPRERPPRRARARPPSVEAQVARPMPRRLREDAAHADDGEHECFSGFSSVITINRFCATAAACARRSLSRASGRG